MDEVHNTIIALFIGNRIISLSELFSSIPDVMKNSYLNSTNSLGRNLLSLALHSQNMPMTKLLLENGADPNWSTNLVSEDNLFLCRKITWGPGMFIACERLIKGESSKPLKLLLKYGGDINICNNRKESLLHIAIRRRSFKTSKFLLKRGINVNLVDNKGQTPLYIAAKIGDKKVLNLLLKFNANIHFKSQKAGNVLNACIYSGRTDVLNKLLYLGVELVESKKDRFVAFQDCSTGSPWLLNKLVKFRKISVQNRIECEELLASEKFLRWFFPLNWQEPQDIIEGLASTIKEREAEDLEINASTSAIALAVGFEEVTKSSDIHLLDDPTRLQFQGIFIRERILGIDPWEVLRICSKPYVNLRKSQLLAIFQLLPIRVDHDEFTLPHQPISLIYNDLIKVLDPIVKLDEIEEQFELEEYIFFHIGKVLSTPLKKREEYSYNLFRRVVLHTCATLLGFLLSSPIKPEFVKQLKEKLSSLRSFCLSFYQSDIVRAILYEIHYEYIRQTFFRRSERQNFVDSKEVDTTLRFFIFYYFHAEHSIPDHRIHQLLHFVAILELPEEKKLSLYATLIKAGNHIDTRDNLGRTFCDIDKNYKFKWGLSNSSLQCKTAAIVKKFNLDYSFMPLKMQKFIQLH